MILDHLNDKPQLNHDTGTVHKHPKGQVLPDIAQPGGGSGSMGGGVRPGEYSGADPYAAQGIGKYGQGQTYGGGRENVDKAALGQIYGNMSGSFPDTGAAGKGGPATISPMAPTGREYGGYYGPGGKFTPNVAPDPAAMRAHALEQSGGVGGKFGSTPMAGIDITHEQFGEGGPRPSDDPNIQIRKAEQAELAERQRIADINDRVSRFKTGDMSIKEKYDFKASGEYDKMIWNDRMSNRAASAAEGKAERISQAPGIIEQGNIASEMMFDEGGVDSQWVGDSRYQKPTTYSGPRPVPMEERLDDSQYQYQTDSGGIHDPQNPELLTIRTRPDGTREQYKEIAGIQEWYPFEEGSLPSQDIGKPIVGGAGFVAEALVGPAISAVKGVSDVLSGGAYGDDPDAPKPWEDKPQGIDQFTPSENEVRMAGGDFNAARQAKIQAFRAQAEVSTEEGYLGDLTPVTPTIGPELPSDAVTTDAAPAATAEAMTTDIDNFFNQATGTSSGFTMPTAMNFTSGTGGMQAIMSGSADLTDPANWEALRQQAQASVSLPSGYYSDVNGNIQFEGGEGTTRLPEDQERKLMQAHAASKQAGEILEKATSGRITNENNKAEYAAQYGAKTESDLALLEAKDKYEIAADVRQEQAAFNDWRRKEGSALLADQRARTIQGDRLNAEKSMNRLRESGETARLATKLHSDAVLQGRQLTFQQAEGKAERILQKYMQDEQHSNDLQMLSRKGLDERDAIRLQGNINSRMAILAESGDTNRLAMQIRSQEFSQGREMSMEMAMAGAERAMRQNLQDDQIAAQIETLGLQGDQELSAIQAKGREERQSLAVQLTYQDSLQGQQREHEYYQAMASRQHDRMMQTTQGRQELERIKESGAEQRTSMEKEYEIGGREMEREEESQRAMRSELAMGLDAPTGSPEMDAAITQARQSATTFTTNLNTALKTASETGDFETLNASIAAELPPLPSGIVWDRGSGTFQQREGFQGREIDPAVQRFMSTTSAAFRARDRAEQVSQKATEIKTSALLERQKQQAADQDFRQAMLTNEIDSAEEALARQAMAETAATASKTKLEHLNMLLNLMQNPVQLGMAKRHGLLGQIETTLGFNLSNVPEAPAGGSGIPTSNEWNTMDSESQAFNIAAYIEQGGTPDEFMRMLSASAPAALQQTAYAVL